MSKYPNMNNTMLTQLPLKNIVYKYLFLIFFGTMVLASLNTFAQGDLLLYPKRVVFDGSKKYQVLNLANTGKDTVRYLISAVQLKMKEDGAVDIINSPDSGQRFADKNFRFFPRSVLLAPNEAQTVKIQLLNTSNLEPGEYRSHLYFRAEADKKPLGEKDKAKDSGAISVNVVAVFGISIPVIIRVGESTTAVSINNPLLQYSNDLAPSLKLTFKRTGNMSTYGDITVNHISTDGKITAVGVAKGMALYAPNSIRQFNLMLDKNAQVNYHVGKLQVLYTTQPDAKLIKMAETTLDLL